ncbi:hypothetical protein GQ600_932 [Phytophthora cactorum]|nr:hypothetical protein GQ600_932 [Phytophthora cactorum]
MKILHLRQIGDPKSQISTPSATSDQLVAVKNLFQLLKDAGLPEDVDRGEQSNEASQISPQNSATERHSESSQYASATSEPDSDLSVAPRCMSLGPFGAKMLRSRLKEETTLPPESRKDLRLKPIRLPMSSTEFNRPVGWSPTSRPPWIGS